MTEIGLLRFASVPPPLVRELREHVANCPVCRCDDSRACGQAIVMVERCVRWCEVQRRTGVQQEPGPTPGSP